MSIIHDALKKAEAFRAGKKSETDATPDLAARAPSLKKWKDSSLKPKMIIVGAGLVMVVVGWMMFGESLKPKLIDAMGFSKSPPKEEMAPVVVDPQILAQEEAKAKAAKEQKKVEEAQKLADEFLSLYEKGNFAEAQKVIEDLINKQPTEPSVYNNYGMVLRRMGKNKAALEAYGKALALDPNYQEALNNMATIHLSDREYNQAKSLLQRALAINPVYLDACLHLAIAYEKNDEVEKAKQYYEHFLEISEGKVDRKIRLQIESRLTGLLEK